MGWMDASDYLVLDQTVKDRINDAERFRAELTFRFGTRPAEPAPVVMSVGGRAAHHPCFHAAA